MPLFPVYAAAFVARSDVVNIHMPQLEASLPAAGLKRKPSSRPAITCMAAM